MQIELDQPLRAIVHTEHGDIAIELLPSIAPIAVNNFVFLVREGFYEDTTFHRVVAGFIAQAGDPGGSGRGGPGYRFPDEISETAIVRGTVGMANGGPNTNGSQFFIALRDSPQLNGRYSVLGRVIEGIEVADALAPRDPAVDSDPGDHIDSIEIVSS
ncbi:MAG: peptidylprolyl isomerase [Chloroflexi bacterium]|nr:peptidylprolyl isomerase [Chloroflexota bacterium]MDA1148142.1 peptidylprolyl isomerase [Chloroflexota bacterium]PKB56453.1 MAG: hypothetical protein BZY69_01675 [SAR202 cluster bacterium Casp-Chloro-G1]